MASYNNSNDDNSNNYLNFFMLNLLQESSVSSMDTNIVVDNASGMNDSSSLSMSLSRLSFSNSSRRWSAGSGHSSFTKAISRWESYPFAVSPNSSLSSSEMGNGNASYPSSYSDLPAPPQLPRRRRSLDDCSLVPEDLRNDLLRIEEEAEKELPPPPPPYVISPREASPKIPQRRRSSHCLEENLPALNNNRVPITRTNHSPPSPPPSPPPTNKGIEPNTSPPFSTLRQDQQIHSTRLQFTSSRPVVSDIHETADGDNSNDDGDDCDMDATTTAVIEEGFTASPLKQSTKGDNKRLRKGSKPTKHHETDSQTTITSAPPRFPRRRESDDSETKDKHHQQHPQDQPHRPRDNVVSCSVLDASGNVLSIKQALTMMNARLPKRRTSPNKMKAILSQATQSMMLQDDRCYAIRTRSMDDMDVTDDDDDDDDQIEIGSLPKYLEASLELNLQNEDFSDDDDGPACSNSI